MPTLLQSSAIAYLDAQAVRRNGVGDYPSLIKAVELAYRAHERDDVRLTMAEYLRYPGRPSYDRIIPLLGYLGAPFEVSGLKQICSSTSNHDRGLPRASGLIILNDPDTGRPFSIMEGSLISAARTAAVTGLAMREFLQPNARQLGLIGCGQLAAEHIRMIASAFSDSRLGIKLFDARPERAHALARLAQDLGLAAEPAASARDVLADADVVITATTSEEPNVRSSDLRPGALYLAVSLLDAHLDVFLDADLIVVDDLKQCLHEGRPLQILADQGRLPVDKVVEMGAWLAAGRRRPEHIRRIVFNPMGTVITDLAVAKTIFDTAMASGDFGDLSL